MPWEHDRVVMRRHVLAVPVFALILACSPAAVSSPVQTPKLPYTQPPPTPTLSPIATVAPTGHGRPYTAEMIAAELQDVPYTFPRELQTPFMAASLAEYIWTYDGRPYREIQFGGSCGEGVPRRCEFTISGLPAYAPTREETDHWWFTVGLDSPVLGPEAGHSLRGFPPEFAADLDPLVRSLDTEGRLAGMAVGTIGWAPPPPEDAFVLRYRKGDLEGAHIVEVLLDRTNRKILSITGVQRGLDRD
jgi:hypothetical protein